MELLQRSGGGVLILITSVALSPEMVNVKQTFLISVGIMEIVIPNDFIRYCGTFYSGQDFAF